MKAQKRTQRRMRARIQSDEPEPKAQLRRLEEEAEELTDRLWELVGPDPLLSQLAAAQAVEDAKPNPDDPDR